MTGYTIKGKFKDGQIVNASFTTKEFTVAAFEYKRLLSLSNQSNESGKLDTLSLNNSKGKMIHQYTNQF
tara:strand:+ start:280 stop:486 length:207 start_codon:yes stop_codon:yes gene_type:complete